MNQKIQSLKSWCARDRIRTCTPRGLTETGESKSPASTDFATRAQTEGRPSGFWKPRRPPRFLGLRSARNCKPTPLFLFDPSGNPKPPQCGPYCSFVHFGKHRDDCCAGLPRKCSDGVLDLSFGRVGPTSAATTAPTRLHVNNRKIAAHDRNRRNRSLGNGILEGGNGVIPALLVCGVRGVRQNPSDFVFPTHGR